MYRILTEAVQVCNLTLRNRVFMSAAACYTATPDGDIDHSRPLIHFEIAKGGCALVPTGGVGGIHPSGRAGNDRPMFNCDERIASFKIFADNVHAGGASPFLQATHSGMGAAKFQLSQGKKPFIPSYYLKDPKGGFAEINREYCPAIEAEIREVISAFGDAAVRAKKAGFDGIQIHAAHESLLAQWFSPICNKRNDAWGGTVENRCRLHREILRDIKTKAGRDFPTIMKLGIEDVYPDGTIAEEGIQAAEIIAQEGNVDIIEPSQGLQDIADIDKTCMRTSIISPEKEAYYRDWTKRVKSAVAGRALVTLQGGLRSLTLMEEVVAKGDADFVSMCRPYICEPNIVNRWISGDTSKAKCVSCNKCITNHILNNKPLVCVFNDKA